MNETIQNTLQFIRNKAEEFGAKTDNEFSKSYVERKNIKEDTLNDKGAFFGFIHPEEDQTGPYHDFSLVIFL